MKLKRRHHETRMEMTPLIDVVFLLLVFFVFSLVLMVRADVLDLKLPEVGSGATASGRASIRVTLTTDGSVLVGGDMVVVEELGSAVLALLEASPGTPVVVTADARAEAGALIELADRLVEAGVTEFSVLGSPRGNGGGGTGTGSGGGESANPGAAGDE